MRHIRAIAIATASLVWTTSAQTADRIDGIKSVAKGVANTLVDNYPGTRDGNPIGLFEEKYYFWSSAVVWDSLVDYWYLTGDSTYNALVAEALHAQSGDGDYMPANQTRGLTNDDQSFWGRAALTAAERDFPSPPDSVPYIRLASNVFDSQVTRWDTESCNGGLRWVILPGNAGFDAKDSGSVGSFFQLAARLARFTGNGTYSDWADKAFGWLESVGLATETGAVYDLSTVVENECPSISKLEWSVRSGLLLHGSAVMYNITGGSPEWKGRIEKILGRVSSAFAEDGILVEPACESRNTCNTDHRFYKGVMASSLAQTAYHAPFTASEIAPILRTSADGVVSNACIADKGICGFVWTPGADTPEEVDIGPQVAALQVFQANLVPTSGPLKTQGDSSAPTSGTSTSSSGGSGSVSGGSGSAPGNGTGPTPTGNAPAREARGLWSVFTVVSVVAVLGFFS